MRGWRRLRRDPPALLAALVCAALALAALLAPVIAPADPRDPANLDLLNAQLPPLWFGSGQWPFLLGTDDQGADVLSSILFGLRISLLVGLLAVALSLLIGVTLGLVSGYFARLLDAAIMRAADVQLTFPAFLTALLIGGVTQSLLPPSERAALAVPAVIAALGIAHWPHFARLVRGATMIEKNRDYVRAARLIGERPARILFTHILPNVLTPVLVLATLDIAFAVMGEATLSFLGVGVPITDASLGTLIRLGYDKLFSGAWWIAVFPSLALVALVMAINVLGDSLRDAFGPSASG